LFGRVPSFSPGPAARADIERVLEIWTEQLDRSGGPFLFGAFSIADAYYAPVCSRIRTYALPGPAAVAGYVETIQALPAMQEWTREALNENDFLDFDEPYRQRR
jgi:glutathione S-transferase